MADDRSIFDRVRDADAGVSKLMGLVGQWHSDPRLSKNDFPVIPSNMDPIVAQKSMIRLGNAMGKWGLAAFSAKQAALWAMNNDTANVYMPGSALTARIPFVGSIVPIAQKLDDLRWSVDEQPGYREKKALERERKVGSGEHHDLISNHERFRSRTVKDSPPFFKPEFGIGMVGPQNVINTARPRSVGAKSQDDSLVPFNSAIDPSEMFNGDGSNRSILELALDKRNLYSKDAPRDTHPVFTMANIVDNAIDGRGDPLLVTDLRTGLSNRKRLSLEYVFRDGGTKLGKWVPDQNMRPSGRQREYHPDEGLKRSAFAHGIIPMNFKGEDKFNQFIHKNNAELPVSDTDAYVPLSFTDLRPIIGRDGDVRTVYFRPIITSLTEDFAPEWSKETFFGRSDQVVHYVSTVRNVFLSFEMHAFGPEDVKVIHNKLEHLRSMVYPQYGVTGLMESGPVCRIRVGDYLVSRGTKLGLPGVIDSLNFDATDSIWELKENLKVPRSIKISVSFHVLHERPMGRFPNGDFGELTFKEPESVPESTQARNTTTNDVIEDVGEYRVDNNLRIIDMITEELGIVPQSYEQENPIDLTHAKVPKNKPKTTVDIVGNQIFGKY